MGILQRGRAVDVYILERGRAVEMYISYRGGETSRDGYSAKGKTC